MTFPFSAVCELLQSLENDQRRRRNKKGDRAIVEDWFARYREELDDDGTDKCALLSTLLPERRTDRVFGIKEKTLQPKIARAYGLGHSRVKELSRWTVPGSEVDLAECVEEILLETPSVRRATVTVEEIDAILHALASKNSFSAPSVRSSGIPSTDPSNSKHDELLALFLRLTAREAKWATRLVLKCFLPVVVPEWLVYARCHRLLPTIMRIHDDFTIATRLLEQERSRVTFGEIQAEDLPRLLKPQIGVKVGRQTWLKGRSIKHCLEMGRGFMSVEQKLDGEYCQIHIDLSKGSNRIQIFSKSGKDSTQDKKRLHGAIEASLGLGTTLCKFKHCCILEGEMVVWSDKEQRILEFDKIRKHISRSGRYIGTGEDSQAHHWEHLMIVYYDVLRVDDDSLLNVRHSARISRLSKLVQCQPGRAALLAQRQIINFSSRVAADDLKEAFASCIVRREEGLVLKPDEPYFSFGNSKRRYASCCVKLKKGFVKGLGDIGDLAVISGRYCPTRAKVLKMPTVKYTHFYLGCLTNKEAVERWDARPEFRVVNEVEVNATMMEQLRRTWITDTISLGDDKAPVLQVPPGISQGRKISTAFTEPAVFEITCFSFHKGPDTGFWSLRFPYVSKIHSDRTWKDCITFQELQELAEEEVKCPEREDSQELARWIEALEEAEPKTRKETISHESQSTETTASTTTSQPRTPQRSIEESPVRPPPASVIAAVKAGLPTPPTSSAAQPQKGSSPPQGQPTHQSSRKRQREQLLGSPRRTKPRQNEPEVIDLTSPTLSNSQRSQRQPLEDITSAPSSHGNLLTPTAPCPSSVANRLETTDESKSRPPAPTAPTLSDPSSLLPPRPSPLSCGYAGRVCALAGFSVLLSPCIANMPLLTEDILPAHGVSDVFTDIPSWLASHATQIGVKRRLRKLVLVERHRNESTSAFLRDLESRPGRRRNGQAEIILAYDWRLLEAITEEERKNQKSNGNGTRQTAKTGANREELWRRHYFGCIDESKD